MEDLAPEKQDRLDLVAVRPTQEGVWKRAAFDARRVGLSFRFMMANTGAAVVAAVIGALVLADPQASTAEKALVAGASAAIGFVALLLIVAVWSVARAPFRQRDEARAEMKRLQREAHPEFPRHVLTVDQIWYLDIENTPVPNAITHVIFVPIAFTTREHDRRVSLDVDLLWSRVVRGDRMGPYSLRSFQHQNLPELLRSPVAVEPESTVKGDFAFDASLSIPFDFGGVIRVSVQRGFEVSLRLTDHVTGAMTERLIESNAIPPDESGALSSGTGPEAPG